MRPDRAWPTAGRVIGIVAGPTTDPGKLRALRRAVLDGEMVPLGAPGVVIGEEPQTVLDEITGLLARHRVWERFPAAVRE